MQANEPISNPNQETSDTQSTNVSLQQQPNDNVSSGQELSQGGKETNKWLIIGLVIFALVVLGVAGIFAYQNYQLKEQVEKLSLGPSIIPTKELQPTPRRVALTLSPTPTSDPTASWKVYRNDNFGFQLSYPPEWDLKLGAGQAFLFQAFLKKEDGSQRPVEMPGGTTITPYYQILVSIQNNPKNLSAKDFYLKDFTPEARKDAERGLEEINVAGEKAIKYQEAVGPSSGLATTVSVSHDSKIYQLSYGAIAHKATHEKYLTIFNTILSTFKFIN